MFERYVVIAPGWWGRRSGLVNRRYRFATLATR
jgi:hypothetical protein